ncbi:MAG: DNA polymerase/3'-5' exonuclease PolX [Candidatus Omnitrophica bacterium]|nr:DNA polymerase/3'-5' exonuclease PolX [Candidatus Omnitrophota bacterium]
MKQHEIAALFAKMADLLEFQGENVFRIRAYRRAAQNLESFSGDLDQLAAAGTLQELSGIGADLAAKIQEYLTTGRIAAIEQLTRSMPKGALEMMEIPGVGPKTAKQLSQQRRIASVAQLEAAARAGQLKGLPGFQQKKEQNILKGIEIVKRGQARMHLGLAWPLAQEIARFLEKVPGVSRVSPAGSLRRMKETIGDLDLLAAAAKPLKVMDALRAAPFCARVLVSGETKTSIITTGGIQVDVRVVKPDSFGAALQYFTGSKEHNVRLRELAAKQGLKINEYGVFSLKTGRKMTGREEEDVYKAVGLRWMPPELREDRGELDAARTDALPQLVEANHLRGDFHIHTNWSDGSDSLPEVVRAGEQMGYDYIAICDHSQSLKVAHGMTVERLRQQMKEIRQLNARSRSFRVLMGAEVDILNEGRMDYPDEVLAELDFVVGSIHSGFTQSEAALTKRMITAMRNPYVTLIAHPTGRLMGQREPYAIDLEAVFRAAKETGTAMEINAYPQRLDLCDTAAHRAGELGIMLAISTDTHGLDQYQNITYGLGVARRAWLTKRQLLNCFSLKELLSWIGKKRRRA